MFSCYFPLACVLRCNPTVLSASALDIALIKFRCLSPVLICVVLWLDIGHFCSCSGLSPLTFLVPHGGGSSYSALVDLGGAFFVPQFWTWFGAWGQRRVGFPFVFPVSYLCLFLISPCSASFAFRRKLGDAVAVRETVKLSWCDIFKGIQPFVGSLASPSMVACDPTLGLLRNLRFRNPDDFQAGSLRAQPAIWEKLLSNISHEYVDLMDVIKEGVIVEQFLTHFKGDFKGKVLIRIAPLRSCWKTPSLVPSFRISFLLPYCIGCRPGSCRFGESLVRSHSPT